MEWHGQRSRVERETVVVAATAAQWQALWRRIGKPAPTPLPAKSIAVGVFLGQRRTGGYRIEIVSVADAGGARVVAYREHRPTGAVTMALTYPYLVRLLPRADLPTRVEKLP